MARPEARPWRGRAFGLDLAGHFPAPGLERDVGPAPRGHTDLRLREGCELVASWPSREAETVFEESVAGARFALARHAERGFAVDHDYYGRFAVAADGSLIECAPRDMEAWRWQRLLVGQLLPLAALLRGLEPLHASAVAIAG